MRRGATAFTGLRYSHSLLDGIALGAALLAWPLALAALGAPVAWLSAALIVTPLTSGLISFARLVVVAFPLVAGVASYVRGWPFRILAAASFTLEAALFVWYVGNGWVA